jgi:hypothetical protein
MLPKLGLDSETFALIARDMECTYVRGPMGTNAVYPMVRRKFVGQTAAKVVRLADIYRLPSQATDGLTASETWP